MRAAWAGCGNKGSVEEKPAPQLTWTNMSCWETRGLTRLLPYIYTWGPTTPNTAVRVILSLLAPTPSSSQSFELPQSSLIFPPTLHHGACDGNSLLALFNRSSLSTTLAPISIPRFSDFSCKYVPTSNPTHVHHHTFKSLSVK